MEFEWQGPELLFLGWSQVASTLTKTGSGKSYPGCFQSHDQSVLLKSAELYDPGHTSAVVRATSAETVGVERTLESGAVNC